MKLYNFKFVQNLYGKSLIITIDLNQFNNVDIHIDCIDQIEYFMGLINSQFFETKLIQNRIEIFCEENYCSEIDPYRRGEN